ncbi:MAG TPA: hypothetical protein DCS74_04780 [Veillonellaceae bacterium]|nr:hypothetical protein [Veillonellaceae bacterium]
MKMKHAAVAAAAAGMLAFGSVFGVSAAGIGYVNMNEVMQSHPKMEKAQLDMKAAVQKAQDDFNKQSQGKSDQDKQQLAQDFQKQLSDKERTTMQPIIKDVMGAIENVRKAKSLDVILDQGAVISGGVDVTNDVETNLKK